MAILDAAAEDEPEWAPEEDEVRVILSLSLRVRVMLRVNLNNRPGN